MNQKANLKHRFKGKGRMRNLRISHKQNLRYAFVIWEQRLNRTREAKHRRRKDRKLALHQHQKILVYVINKVWPEPNILDFPTIQSYLLKIACVDSYHQNKHCRLKILFSLSNWGRKQEFVASALFVKIQFSIISSTPCSNTLHFFKQVRFFSMV